MVERGWRSQKIEFVSRFVSTNNIKAMIESFEQKYESVSKIMVLASHHFLLKNNFESSVELGMRFEGME